MRLQSSVSKFVEQDEEYINYLSNRPADWPTKEEEIYVWYAQNKDCFLEIAVKATNARDKNSCLLEELQEKENWKISRLLNQTIKTLTSESSASGHKVAKFKLSKYTLSIFNNDLLLWKKFSKSFNASVDLKDLPPAQKFPYLKRRSKGKALSSIGEMLSTSANYEMVKDLLKNQFGDSDVTRQLLYNQFKKLTVAAKLL